MRPQGGVITFDYSLVTTATDSPLATPLSSICEDKRLPFAFFYFASDVPITEAADAILGVH
jgi:hypothetical protein